MDNNNKRGLWSSRLAYVIAVSGSAVGLGNIWKFPYIAGENGGGAFVLFYLLCVVAIGIPIMIAETLIGRHTHLNPADAVGRLAERSGKTYAWQGLGLLTILSGFLILSFYSMIAGWALDYIYLASSGHFTQVTAEGTQQVFADLTSNPVLLIVCHTLVMLVTATVIALGVKKGIERFTGVLLPLMILLLLVLVFYAMSSGFIGRGLSFLFEPDFGKLTSKTALIALGHACFTLSLALGIVMTYGSYLDGKIRLIRTSVLVAVIDTVVALIAGLAIFPLVFAHGLEPGAGPGLIFKTLPIAFGHMPMGSLFATLFFLMLLMTALTSTISLLEPSVILLRERLRWSRLKATVICSVIIWLLGLGSIFSLNIASDMTWRGMTFFDLINYAASNVMLPLGALGIAVFVGYKLDRHIAEQELLSEGRALYYAWRFSIRYLAPVAIFIVFLNALGFI